MPGEQTNMFHEIIHFQAKSKHAEIYQAKMMGPWGGKGGQWLARRR